MALTDKPNRSTGYLDPELISRVVRDALVEDRAALAVFDKRRASERPLGFEQMLKRLHLDGDSWDCIQERGCE